MKVHRCTKCEKRGGHLVFRQTKKNVKWKYAYVGHYDPSKTSKRRWCSLNDEQLNRIEFDEDWYQKNYGEIIQTCQREYKKKGASKIFKETTRKACELLEENVFLTYRIADRVNYNFNHLFITEKFIEDTIGDEYTDKPKK